MTSGMITWEVDDPMAVDPDLLDAVVRILVEASRPSKVVLFGSHARGDAGPKSDLDLLVVEKSVQSRRAEMVRLTRLVSHLKVPVDIVVTTVQAFAEWSDTPGTILYEAAREGRVLYDEAA